ncbi:hypothetical protein [uncultured Umboniibacter sp.]|uniref:HAAS signaling domain-containing protein n=1 Tax=uncultured Umboniibacter sp. TaxID=1798917 RepID=UPI0026018702|nr:hypothetical protein [uncultured Umboniibacter sp.]
MNTAFPINSNTAQQVWRNFDRELVHKLKPLPESEREDIRMEILSHLYDSAFSFAPALAEGEVAPSEEEKLIDAISRLGSPDEYLAPLIEDILLNQKVSKGNPFAILKSLRNGAGKGAVQGFTTLVLGFGYFWVIMVLIMSAMHLVNPDVGVWLYPSGDMALSFEAQPGATQWLPQWFSLIGLVAGLTGYWLLNKVLGLVITKFKA